MNRFAKHLGAAGAAVVVNYATSKAGTDKTVAEIVSAGGKATAVQGDFSKSEDITRVFAELRKQHGKVDILVNNAGVYTLVPVEATTTEEFARQFDLNVRGLLLAVKEASPLFPAEGGSIINIGSGVAKMSPAYGSIYSGTKGAVDSTTIALSKELGPRKIRVNALNPGLIETEGAATAGVINGDFHKLVLNTTPLGRIGQPDDIGTVAVFLASDDSGWVNGQQKSSRAAKLCKVLAASASRMPLCFLRVQLPFIPKLTTSF